MAAFRYWRFIVLENHGDNISAVVDEIDLRTSAGGSRLSVTGNGTASASSVYPGIGSAAGAFDGVVYNTHPSANAWWTNTSVGFPAWIEWDFGAGNEQDINWMGLTNVDTGAAATGSVKRGMLVCSNDRLAWKHHVGVVEHPNTQAATVGYSAGTGVGVSEASAAASDPTSDGLPTILNLPGMVDLENSGDGVISGTVKIDGDPLDTPVRRQVILLREPGAFAIRETWSDLVTGAYEFSGINRRYKYTVLAYDNTHSYRAVLADNVTPDLMT